MVVLIWKYKYVDFTEILDPNTRKTKSKSKTTSKALTLAQWTKAFNSYAAVYIRKFPQAAQALFSYSTFILELAENGHDWTTYDTLFRKERVGGKFPFNGLRQDLAFKAVAGKRPTAGYHEKKQEGGSSAKHFRYGFCTAFNNEDTYCASDSHCKYRHRCNICEGSHPGYLHPGSKGTSRRSPPSSRRYLGKQDFKRRALLPPPNSRQREGAKKNVK